MIKVYIATDGDIHQDAERVIEYSIRKHASEDVEINFIRPGWKIGCTGFTTHRYLIPELCNFEGYAIYLDVDMLPLSDIKELWDYKQPGKWMTTPKRDDVSVIDCSAFRDIPPSDKLKNEPKVYNKKYIRKLIGDRHVEGIPLDWNTCDMITPTAKLIHYTDLNTQPWHPIPNHNYKEHPNQAAVNLFFEYLDETNSSKIV
jgi:hypothetical protein